MSPNAYPETLGTDALKMLRSLRPWKIFLRLLFVILKVKGYSSTAIGDILSVSRKTIWMWQRTLVEDGLDALTQLHYKGQPSKINAYGEQLAFEFDERPVATLKEARHRIKLATGVERSLSQVRKFLQRFGVKRRKVGQIPDNADLKKQEKFKKRKLYPLIKQAQTGSIRLLFVDAVHFVHLPFLGYLYSLKRVFIRAAAGRQRYNVLGALDAVTKKLTTISNETYINAHTVCALLHEIAAQYAGEIIYIVLDNARYQRCKLVESVAKQLGIHLVFLEPYSPHLNLIERLWKFVKKKVLYNECYKGFDNFKAAIISCFEAINSNSYDTELQSLLTLNFQSFSVTN